MKKFKIGDRVVATVPVGCKNAEDQHGIEIGFNGIDISVEFDKDIGGHTYGEQKRGRNAKDGYGWFVLPRNLKLETNRFKAGQIYRVGIGIEEESGNIIKITSVSDDVAYKTLRGKGVSDESFSDDSTFASSLTLLTGPEIGKAIKKYDTEHAEKKSEYNEVKRPAKVGDTIKILEDNCGKVKPGTVWKVKSIESNGDLRITHKDDYLIWDCRHDNYVVISSEEQGKHAYTNEEIAETKKLCGEMMMEAFDNTRAFSLRIYDHGNDGYHCVPIPESQTQVVVTAFDTADAIGVAKCSDQDEYSVWIGRCVALCKALHKPIPAFIMEG